MPDLLLTAARMRAWERAAMEAGTVTGRDLMERAGEGAVGAILAEWPGLAEGAHRAVVLCGPGNNGGDGFVVARLLRDRGWEVECFLYGNARRMPSDARANHDRWAALGPVRPLTAATIEADAFPGRCDLLIDALFGIGLSRPVDLPLASIVPGEALGLSHKVVALDVPSGLCGDSGVLPGGGQCVEPDLTLAFHAAKPGHYLARGPELCSKVVVVDIGLGDVPPPGAEDAARLVGPPAGTDAAKPSGHKYDHGHALVLTGPMGRTGAARLAARAALRVGAGLVTLGAPGGAMMECATQVTAIMLRRVNDADALVALLEDGRINALCLGPGLGVDGRAADLLRAALGARRTLVLDADALTALARDPSLLGLIHDRVVLTPHGGEFRRLAPDLADRLEAEPGAAPASDPWIRARARAADASGGQGGGILARLKGGGPQVVDDASAAGPAGPYSKIDAARDLAGRMGCTVLLKGPDTVIAEPSGGARLHAAAYDRAAPWLATAGAGDVLAGMVAGLLARGLVPKDAAASAAWLHVEAARAFGPGLIAEDLPDLIPAALRAADREAPPP